MCDNNGIIMSIDLSVKNYYIELDEYGGSVRMNLKRRKAGVKDHGSVSLSYEDMDNLIYMLKEMQEHLDEQY